MFKLNILILFVFLSLSCDRQDKRISQHESDLQPQHSSNIGNPTLNLNQLKNELGTEAYHTRGYHGQNTTLAVLDNGFSGLEREVGVSLPSGTRVESGYEGKMAATPHGVKIAQLAYTVATGHNIYDPERPGPDLKLFVTSGSYNNLEHAVTALIKLKQNQPWRAVIAVYAQVWEYGGNPDGSGYINALVKKAVAAGIVWVNAAGNLRQSTYMDQLQLNADQQVTLPHQGQYLRLKVPQNAGPIKLVLAWDEFKDRFSEQTSQWDLDFALLNDEFQELNRADLIQNGEDPQGRKGYSKFSREQMSAPLSQGNYWLKAWSKSSDFYLGARFWFTASGRGVELSPLGQQMVLAPAGLPGVITVGAKDIVYSSHVIEAGRYIKPDLLTSSRISSLFEPEIEGTSTAAAVTAGAISLYLGARKHTSLGQISEISYTQSTSTRRRILRLPQPR